MSSSLNQCLLNLNCKGITWIPGGCCKNADSVSGDLGWSPRFCVYNKVPGDIFLYFKWQDSIRVILLCF